VAKVAAEDAAGVNRVVLPVRTARLTLRDFAPADLESLQLLAGDARVLEYAPAASRALEAVRRARSSPAARRRPGRRRSYELAVVLNRGGKLIGACDLARSGPRAADVGYVLAPRHWGHGYGTEVARALVAFGFGALALERLCAVVAIENDRSRRVLENAGFVWEGLMRRHLQTRGRSWDCHLYVIDRQRWRALGPSCAAAPARGS
jgi:[ribosomal protein S5]-alanine N-acetyltransferase